MDGDRRRRNLALLRKQRAAGLARLTALPAELQIETTNRCRRQCPTCARNFYDRAANPPGDLTPGLLALIEPLFPDAERVLVGGYGEPLLADITDTVIARAHDVGCLTTLITGGGDLDDTWARRLAEAGLDEILLSVDAADEDGMRRWRGVSLAQVLDGLAALRRLRPTVRAVFNVTVQVGNLDQLPLLVRLAAEHRVAGIAVHHQKIYSRTQRGSSLLDIPDHAARVFADTDSLAAELGVDVDLPPLAGTRTCEQPYRLLAIRHDGLVQGCCSAMFESHLPRVVLGRLPDDDLAGLWNAPPMLAAREAALGTAPKHSPCLHCAFRVFSTATHERFLDEFADD